MVIIGWALLVKSRTMKLSLSIQSYTENLNGKIKEPFKWEATPF